jgi:hypothetical protein
MTSLRMLQDGSARKGSMLAEIFLGRMCDDLTESLAKDFIGEPGMNCTTITA